MFGKAGLGGLMQQAQKMQENMKKAQAELAQTEVEGQAGNGLVKVTATCSHVVRKISISPDLISEAAAAINDAHEKGEAATSAKMAQFTQCLPAGMGDFFK